MSENSGCRTIMLVELEIDAEGQREFDPFYEAVFLPAFIEAVPQLLTATRLEEIDGAGTAVATGRFWTVYEVESDDSIAAIESGVQQSAQLEAFQRFKNWKQDALTFFDREFYLADSAPQGTGLRLDLPLLTIRGRDATMNGEVDSFLLGLNLASPPRKFHPSKQPDVQLHVYELDEAAPSATLDEALKRMRRSEQGDQVEIRCFRPKTARPI